MNVLLNSSMNITVSENYNPHFCLLQGMCQHGKCINTMGSFKCDCKPGYKFDEPSHQCIDKNECNTQGISIFCKSYFFIP